MILVDVFTITMIPVLIGFYVLRAIFRAGIKYDKKKADYDWYYQKSIERGYSEEKARERAKSLSGL